MKIITLAMTLMTLCAGTVLGEEYPFIYKGVRPMGMGGAFVAVSDDANALFYNPAGLANINSITVSIFPLEVEVGKNTIDVYRDASDVDFGDPEETTEFLRKYVGDQSHLGLYLFPYYSMPRLAFAIFGTARADLEVQDMQYPRVDAHAVSDIGAGFGYAQPLLDDTLSLGASLKYDHRESLDHVYTVLDITSDDFDHEVRDDMLKGDGVLLDLGAMYTFSDFGYDNVRMGLCANNLIGGSLGDAEDLDPHVDLGVSVTETLWITRTTFALDYVDLFSQLDADNDSGKRIRMGVECRLPMFLTVRAGLYQGYATGGMSLNTRFVQFDALTYAEEIGAYAGQRADRRYVLRFLFGF